jgi:YD repeat-containing protein
VFSSRSPNSLTGLTSTYSYDPAGRVTGRDDGSSSNGLRWTRSYDPSGALKSQTITSGNGAANTPTLASDTYAGFDVEGNVTSESKSVTQPGGTSGLVNGTWNYTDDIANRLKCMAASGSGSAPPRFAPTTARATA